MALWDKLKTELDRAGKAAQGAFDEGKVRLEIFRVRQLTDKAAQALGYAVYNARKKGEELDAEQYARLSSTLAAHEAEAARLEQQVADYGRQRAPGAADADDAPSGGTPDSSPAPTSTTAAGAPAATNAADAVPPSAPYAPPEPPRPPEPPFPGPISG
ncbi:MAG TPA: hypothetical protein VHQ45_16945 [Gemmatimonadaceae bacterium]|nr:hypothetical protein [Gemmatimonadaceae bacterium]